MSYWSRGEGGDPTVPAKGSSKTPGGTPLLGPISRLDGSWGLVWFGGVSGLVKRIASSRASLEEPHKPEMLRCWARLGHVLLVSWGGGDPTVPAKGSSKTPGGTPLLGPISRLDGSWGLVWFGGVSGLAKRIASSRASLEEPHKPEILRCWSRGGGGPHGS